MESHGLYGDRAELYDRLYSFKDYTREAADLVTLARSEGVPDGATVLEAACGTGLYMVPLSETYA